MPGPPSEPTQLKAVKGRSPGRDSGGRPIKQPPPFARIGLEAEDVPEHLGEPGSEMWRHVCEEMAGLDILKKLDRESLTDGCEIWDRLRAARAQRRDYAEEHPETRGIFALDKDGYPKTAPWIKAEETAERAFRLWCIEYGMTPAAEVKLAREVSSSGEPDENPFSQAG